MPQHTIKRFDEELTQLNEKILTMGGLVEKALKRSMNSLLKQDANRAHKVIERDKAINDLEIEIDEMTRAILALRQPAAGDLRMVIATIKMVTDLERIGDLAEDIAEQMLKSQEYPLTHLGTMQMLYEKTSKQLTDSLDAFSRKNLSLALRVIENKQKSRDLFDSMQRENLTYMMEDPRQISSGMIIFSIGRALVRISDHATNIAEMVIYMIQGQDIRHIDHETAAAMIGESIEQI